MKHITFIATSGSYMGSIDNPVRAFQMVNRFRDQQGEPPLFDVQIAGINRPIKLNNGRYSIHPDITLDQLKDTNLIIIPAIDGDLNKGVEEGKAFIPWIVEQYKEGTEIASLCVGAFLLASTGLLKGKNCSTHWRAAHQFQKLFPDVKLITDKIMTDEHGIYTIGGAFSSANLILYLIE